MTSLPARREDGEEVPTGSPQPAADTPVLMNRSLRPGTDLDRLSRFGEDHWDLTPALHEEHATALTINFESIPAALRPTAKFYVWQLINHPQPPALAHARPSRLAVLTIGQSATGALKFVLQWLAEQGITELCQVTPRLLEDYLDSLIDAETPVGRSYRLLTEVRRLWAHRDILPAHMRLPAAPPWDGEDTQDLLGKDRGDRTNRTPRIHEPTMQMLLSWALRFVEDFSEDILAAHAEQQILASRAPRHRRANSPHSRPGHHRHQPGELQAQVADYLDDLRKRREPLPGRRGEDGQVRICWHHLAAVLDCSGSIKNTVSGRMVLESGLPISEVILLSAPITGRLDGEPWQPTRIRLDEAAKLARLLSTACFIIVAYLSGARVGEVLNLRRGCVSHDPTTGFWLMTGLYFKGAEDKDGNKIPEGEIRPDPWVIIEPVAQAIAVLERLHQHHLLFPNTLEHHLRLWGRTGRQGMARRSNMIVKDLKHFQEWVNAYCTERSFTDPIPPDPSGTLVPRQFRRTLAWFIRRRPRGLIAAAIQYGHAHTWMTQGYAGTYESGFPDEYAFQDWLFRIEGLAEDHAALAAKEHVSGPAASAYRYRINAATEEFAGRVLRTESHARSLLGNPLLQIHHGEAMTCVFNATTAACQLRGTADDPMVTPDIDDCRPKCPNLARTDRDIHRVRQQAAELREITQDPLAPPLRHERDQHELTRLERIITDHEQGTAAP